MEPQIVSVSLNYADNKTVKPEVALLAASADCACLPESSLLTIGLSYDVLL